jgi:hypothetical protein
MTTTTATMITAMTGMKTDETVPIADRSRTRTMDLRMNALRGIAVGLMVLSLSLVPLMAAHAAEDQPGESAISRHAKSFGTAVKRDSKAVGAAFKDGAHRVAVAAKVVGHEIATAAKRGAAETRSAFRGDKGATNPT